MKIFEEPLYAKNEVKQISTSKPVPSRIMKKNPDILNGTYNKNNSPYNTLVKSPAKPNPQKDNGIGFLGGVILAGLGWAVVSSILEGEEK